MNTEHRNLKLLHWWKKEAGQVKYETYRQFNDVLSHSLAIYQKNARFARRKGVFCERLMEGLRFGKTLCRHIYEDYFAALKFLCFQCLLGYVPPCAIA